MRIAHAQTDLWQCQDAAQLKRTKVEAAPWTLPPSRAYRGWVLHLWKKRAKHCERANRVAIKAVQIAKRELGTPYVYGGSSPGGFDCSGLTAYIYARLGIHLPHNAAAQYYYGRPVSLKHLRPGDLLFFHGLGHVGIYIGHGRMIHAPHTGANVEIESLSNRGYIDGARRIQ